MHDARNAFILCLAGAVVLLLYSRTETGAQTIGDVVDKVTSTVRGIRNDNPGNIRKSADQWQGLAPVQGDPAFFQFSEMKYGIRAMVVILRNYETKYGLRTVRGIISRWAPSSENNTSAYVSSVSSNMGVGADDDLELRDDDIMFALVSAIIQHENGVVASAFVSAQDIVSGINLAG